MRVILLNLLQAKANAMCSAYLEVSAKTGAQMSPLIELISKYAVQLDRCPNSFSSVVIC